MATVKPSFTDSNSITITLASLANGSINTSSAIDNSTNLFLEAIVQLKIKSGASGVSATGVVNIYLIRSADGGTTYDDNNKVLLGSLPVIANATTYIGSFSTAPLGNVGTNFKLAVENKSGAALDTTAGNHLMQYTGVQYTVV